MRSRFGLFQSLIMWNLCEFGGLIIKYLIPSPLSCGHSCLVPIVLKYIKILSILHDFGYRFVINSPGEKMLLVSLGLFL